MMETQLALTVATGIGNIKYASHVQKGLSLIPTAVNLCDTFTVVISHDKFT